jgi:hypothetical protein
VPHIEPYHVIKPAADDPSQRADTHIASELLQAENDRLRRENDSLKSALRAAGRVISPYIK